MRILHVVTCTLISKTEEDVETTVQDVETKDNPVNLTAFFY